MDDDDPYKGQPRLWHKAWCHTSNRAYDAMGGACRGCFEHGHDGPAEPPCAIIEPDVMRPSTRPCWAAGRPELGRAHPTKAARGPSSARSTWRRVYRVGLRRRPRGALGWFGRGDEYYASCRAAVHARVWKAMWRTQKHAWWWTRTPLNQLWTVWWRASRGIARHVVRSEYMTTDSRMTIGRAVSSNGTSRPLI